MQRHNFWWITAFTALFTAIYLESCSINFQQSMYVFCLKLLKNRFHDNIIHEFHLSARCILEVCKSISSDGRKKCQKSYFSAILVFCKRENTSYVLSNSWNVHINFRGHFGTKMFQKFEETLSQKSVRIFWKVHFIFSNGMHIHFTLEFINIVTAI